MQSLQSRFDARWIGEPNSGCWIWHADMNRWGYGVLALRRNEHTKYGRRLMAHRLSWILHFGAIPDGQLVCHKCDTPSCVRPDHLFLGTDKTNADDKVAKRRHAYGSKQWLSHLTENDVIAIRLSNESTYTEARKYGVDYRTISQIRRGDTWKHVQVKTVRDPIAALSNKGEASGMAKLTEAQIHEIRSLCDAKAGTHKQIAAKFGVTKSLIGQIYRRTAWRHI